MLFTQSSDSLLPHSQASMTGRRHRLTIPLKQTLSKLKNLFHIPDHYGQAREHDWHSDSTSSANRIISPTIASLSTIEELSEPTEDCLINNNCLILSTSTPPQGFAHNSATRHDSNASSISTLSAKHQTSPITSPFHSPSSSTSERDIKHGRISYDHVTTSTVSSIFNAYEEEGIANDPVRIIAELEMYIPVTSVMVRILLTKAHLFPGHTLDATQLAAFLEASCNEVGAFLSVWDSWKTTSPYNSSNTGLLKDSSALTDLAGQVRKRTHGQQTADSGSTRIARGGAEVKTGRIHRFVHDVLKSGKQNFKCNLANLLLRIPSRGPGWLMDRVLLWTIVGEYERPPGN